MVLKVMHVCVWLWLVEPLTGELFTNQYHTGNLPLSSVSLSFSPSSLSPPSLLLSPSSLFLFHLPTSIIFPCAQSALFSPLTQCTNNHSPYHSSSSSFPSRLFPSSPCLPYQSHPMCPLSWPAILTFSFNAQITHLISAPPSLSPIPPPHPSLSHSSDTFTSNTLCCTFRYSLSLFLPPLPSPSLLSVSLLLPLSLSPSFPPSFSSSLLNYVS